MEHVAEALCDHLFVPGHWTGSVLFAMLALGCLASAVRHARLHHWAVAVRDASAAAGFACISAGNEEVTGAGFGSALFFAVMFVMELFLRRASRKTRAST